MSEAFALSNSQIEITPTNEAEAIRDKALLRLKNKIKKLKIQAQEVGNFEDIKDAWKTATQERSLGDLNGAAEKRPSE